MVSLHSFDHIEYEKETLSHDSSFEPTLGDMKAFWQDIMDFEKLFFCDTCGSPVSIRYYYEETKQVRCKKGELTYAWKK